MEGKNYGVQDHMVKSDEGLEDGDLGSNNKRWGSRKRKVQHERK